MTRFWPLVDIPPDDYPRRAIVQVPAQTLFALLMPPDDLRLVGVAYYPPTGSIVFTVEHPELSPVPPGDMFRSLEPAYTRIEEGNCIRMEAEWDLRPRSLH